MSRLLRLWLILPMVGAGLVLAAGNAQAADPGPIQIPLSVFPARDPGPTQCPGGTFVATDPGPVQAPVFVLVDPGPTQCPAGIDVLADPGPVQLPAVQNEAVALPLTAADCAEGTALFNQELALLDAAGSGPVGTTAAAPVANDPCPGGTAALAALHGALANSPSLLARSASCRCRGLDKRSTAGLRRSSEAENRNFPDWPTPRASDASNAFEVRRGTTMAARKPMTANPAGRHARQSPGMATA